ncbi:MAG: hypothetical protein ACO1OK_01820, partial [Devosia sp.]
EPVLRPLLGMGARRLVLLDLAPEADALDPLVDELAALSPDLVLAGTSAETGEGSGLLPYLMAERLECPMIGAATGLTLTDEGAEIVTALPGGRRRRLAAALPLVVSVDAKGPAPLLSAFGPARRGAVELKTATAPRDPATDWARKPARARPKRISGPRAEADPATSGRQVLADATPEVAADAILAFLRRQGLLPGATPSSKE